MMKTTAVVLFFICMAMAAIAGCTADTPQTAAPSPAPSPIVVTGGTEMPAGEAVCATSEDCMPAQCCHPTTCTSQRAKQPCTLMCTMVCQGPLDCGAGSCGCVNGRCTVVPAQTPAHPAGEAISVTLEATPRRYSPMMSSTPGIGLTPTVTGFSAADATFEWHTSFGSFFEWNAPDYPVHEIGNPVASNGSKIYWTFRERPPSTKDPVFITVTARDKTQNGALLACSTVTLRWEGNSTVYVQDAP